MEQRYIRNLGSISEEEFEKLRHSHVFVAGCGGLGGHIIDMLLRIGIGKISAADGDVFELSNLNRQLLSNAGSIGKSKAATAAMHAAEVNPETEFISYGSFIDESNAPELIHGCDAVIDALDGIPARKLLKAECDRQGVPYIYGAISGWVAQAAVSLPGGHLLDIIYPENASVSSKSSLAFTPAFCAALQTSLCVRLLCGREIEAEKLYYADLSGPDFEAIEF